MSGCRVWVARALPRVPRRRERSSSTDLAALTVSTVDSALVVLYTTLRSGAAVHGGGYRAGHLRVAAPRARPPADRSAGWAWRWLLVGDCGDGQGNHPPWRRQGCPS